MKDITAAHHELCDVVVLESDMIGVRGEEATVDWLGYSL